MQIDHEGMFVPQPPVAVRVAVRLRPLPAFVIVLMMLVVHVRMVVRHRFVRMRQPLWIVGRPQGPGYPAQLSLVAASCVAASLLASGDGGQPFQ